MRPARPGTRAAHRPGRLVHTGAPTTRWRRPARQCGDAPRPRPCHRSGRVPPRSPPAARRLLLPTSRGGGRSGRAPAPAGPSTGDDRSPAGPSARCGWLAPPRRRVPGTRATPPHRSGELRESSKKDHRSPERQSNFTTKGWLKLCEGRGLYSPLEAVMAEIQRAAAPERPASLPVYYYPAPPRQSSGPSLVAGLLLAILLLVLAVAAAFFFLVASLTGWGGRAAGDAGQRAAAVVGSAAEG